MSKEIGTERLLNLVGDAIAAIKRETGKEPLTTPEIQAWLREHKSIHVSLLRIKQAWDIIDEVQESREREGGNNVGNE